MTSLLDRFVSVVNFKSYEDFKENFTINIPDNFNFAYDIVDVYAAQQPEKQALVWCDDNDNEAVFNFKDLQYYSNKTANLFTKCGMKKGDNVMLILKSSMSSGSAYWPCTE
jgi:acetyl-CoA synthetase